MSRFVDIGAVRASRPWDVDGRTIAGMRAVSVLLVLLLSALPAAAEERTLESGDRVRWDAGLDEAAARVALALPAIRAEVEDRLGFPFRGPPAEVVLVRGHAAMQREASPRVPDWAAGVCLADRGRIVLRIDHLTPESPVRSIQTTLRHEWVHLAWGRRAGERRHRLPRWVEEGLAEEIGGGVTVDAGSALDVAAAFDRLIPFAELTTDWPAEAERAALAYRQGQSFVAFLVRERGWPDLHRVLERLADGAGEASAPGQGSPFEVLVHEQTGTSLDRWIARWRAEVERDARPWFHLLGQDLGWTLLVFAALLSVGAFFFVRRRRRRAIDALPDL